MREDEVEAGVLRGAGGEGLRSTGRGLQCSRRLRLPGAGPGLLPATGDSLFPGLRPQLDPRGGPSTSLVRGRRCCLSVHPRCQPGLRALSVRNSGKQTALQHPGTRACPTPATLGLCGSLCQSIPFSCLEMGLS